MAQASRPTVTEVLEWVKDLNDWFSVGEKIGVSYSKLRNIEDKYPVETVLARTEMVETWLADDQKASWSKLADGMEYAEQRWLARKIRETYNCPKPITRSRQPAPAQSHAQAHSKKPASSHPHHSSYSAQIAPPRQPPSPPPTVQPYEMVGKSFECSCRKCSLESLPKTGGRSTFLPNLPFSPNLSGTDRQQRENKLKQESDAMIFRFGGFVSRILRSFKSQSISVPALIECISNFGAFQPNREQSPLLLHRMEQLKVAGSIDEIFLLVSDYVSYFNHALMVHMVEALGSREDQEELEDFLDHFESFSKRQIFETPMYMYGYMWLQSETLVVLKTEEKRLPRDSCTVKELFVYLGKISKIIGVLPHVLHMCKVEVGSLQVVCRMPSFVAEEVFPLSGAQEKELNEAGIAQLHCPEYCHRKPGSKDQQKKESDEMGSSDFMSLEDGDHDMIMNCLAYDEPLEPSMYIKVAPPAGRPGGSRETRPIARKPHRTSRNLLYGQLKMCCHYHERMHRLRENSCALVMEADVGYEADSETSGTQPLLKAKPGHHSRKRLRWHLARSHY